MGSTIHGIPIQAVSPSGEVLREYPSITCAARESYMSTFAVRHRCNHYGEPIGWLHSPEMQDYTFRYTDFLHKQPPRSKPRQVMHCAICKVDRFYNILEKYDTIKEASLATGYGINSIRYRIDHKMKREWSGQRYSFRREIDIDLLGKQG